MKYIKPLIRLSLLLTFTCLIFTINSSEVFAEQTTGIIRGSVTDETGNPVSGASVQIIHIPSGSKSSTSSGK